MGAPTTATPTPTNPALQGLEPATLWGYFECLTQLPRPSKHEHKVVEWLQRFAEERGLRCQLDAVGNVIISRDGTAGGEKASTVIIQGHVDMVTEQDKGVQHDFMVDPIQLLRDGDWIKAKGTTLGADNGCGVAAALTLLDQPPSVKLPPLECLFTIDEEAGMSGAIGLDAGLLSGRIMLNLDTEDWGDIFIGCAGGGESELSRHVHLQDVPITGYQHMQLVVEGLLGGHSGIDIHKYRANAVKVCASVCEAVKKVVPEAFVVEISGGNKSNAIARDSHAELLIPSASQGDAELVVAQQLADLREQYGRLETGLDVRLQAVTDKPYPAHVMNPGDTDALLGMLMLLPHGVWKMSHAVDGLVETSNNVASVTASPIKDNGSLAVEYRVANASRSTYKCGLKEVQLQLQRVADVTNAKFTAHGAYPGWAPDPNSKILQVTKDVISGITKRAPHVGAIHAGLECGVIGEKIPGIEMVSYGPTIQNAHSPDERVQISTVQPFWQATLEILQRIADNRM